MIVRSLGAALVAFTRVPLPFVRLEALDFRRGVWHLPLLAWLISALQLCLIKVSPWGAGAALTTFFVVFFPILLSGAMHEDGLGDFADAIFGSPNREKRLAIMKDPRIGIFALLAVLGVIALQFLCLQAIALDHLFTALVVSQVTARGLALSIVARLPYVQQASSRAGSYLPSPGWQGGLAYAALCVAASWYFLPSWSCVAFTLGVFLLSHELWARYLRQAFYGYTGDCLGTIIKVTETLLLLGFSWYWQRF